MMEQEQEHVFSSHVNLMINKQENQNAGSQEEEFYHLDASMKMSLLISVLVILQLNSNQLLLQMITVVNVDSRQMIGGV